MLPEDVIAFLGRFHVLTVHLPIGVIVLAVGLEAVSTPKRWRGRFDATLGAILGAALVSAIAAYLLGTALAREGGHPTRPLELHRNLALVVVVTSAICCGAWWLHRRRGVTRWVHRGALAGLIACLTATAHAGGSLTHGERYLVQKAPPGLARWLGQPDEVADPRTAASDATDVNLFDTAIQPILVERCAACHGAELAKGGLRLDSLDAIVKGARSGPVMVAGRADASSLVLRIEKPLADDEHMPPADQPQPTAAEIALLRFWIERDGARSLEVRDLLAPEDTRPLLVAAAARAASKRPPPAAPSGPASGSPLPSASAADPPPATSALAVAPTRSTDPLAPVETATEPTPIAAPPPTTPPAPLRGTAANSSSPAPSWAEVAPVLASRCGPCHGATKQKSGLRTDSLEALARGGHGGPAVVLGDPRRGSLMERVKLDSSDPMHMPPAEEPQLTPGDLQLIERWLTRGPAGAKTAPATPVAGQPEAPTAPSAASSDASSEALPPAAPAAASQPRKEDASPATSPASSPESATSRPATGAPRGGCAACRVAPETSTSPARGAAALLALLATGLGLGVRRRRRLRHTTDAARDEPVDEARVLPGRSADLPRAERPR